MKKFAGSIGVVALVAVGVLVPATTSNASDLGGWDERSGVLAVDGSTGAVGTASVVPVATVNHRGASETKVISGTSNKRAHGWTTWSGVRHYTTAQLERGSGAVITSSGRKWGTSGTEAVSAYKAFKPNAADNGWGHAKTYYGK